jgi:glycosyltransferase involved in cell wall biosynthesis
MPIKKSKILILTCLWKRPEVFEIFKENIKILKEKYDVDLLVVGSEGEVSANLCKEYHYVEAPNQPLSNKWNAGIKFAENLTWDYLLILGSDDIINDLQFYYDKINEGFDFVGALDCWTYNLANDKIYYFKGYENYRKGESVGAGRLISRRIIESMNYELWDTGLKSSLDYSFEQKLNLIPNIKKCTFIGKKEGIYNLGIYTSENITKICMFAWDEIQIINKDLVLDKFDKRIIDKIKLLYKKICLIIVPVYNEERNIINCLNHIIKQTYKDIRIAVIDDCSTDETLRVVQSYRDDRLMIYHNNTNKGCYNSINIVLQNETDYDCFMIQGADDIMLENRVEKQFINYDDKYMASMCLYRRKEGDVILTDNCYGHSMLCYSRKVFEEIGYFDDIRFAGDTEYWLRFYRKYGDSRLKKINEIHYIAYSFPNSLTNKIYPIGGEERKNYCIKFEQEHLLMEKTENYYRDFIDKNKIVFSLAALQDRVESLKDTIKSINNQCDKIHIYCNEWDSIPDFLITNYKIIYYKSQEEAGNMGDVGKFYGLQNETGYLFSIDDDLIYPINYVSEAIKGLLKYNYPISFHGKIFDTPPIKSYHKEGIIENFRCQNIVTEDRIVHIAGTGCFAYHTDMIRFDIKDFQYINMSDILVSILTHKKGLKLIVLAHREGFIQESQKVDYEKSIYYKNYLHESVHVKLINDNYKCFNNFVEHIKKDIIFAPEIIPEIDPIYMKLTIGDDKIMTLVKLIVIKEMDGDQKFATIGDILRLEESTANVLIEKGLVRIYNEVLKKELEQKAEETILADALENNDMADKKETTVSESHDDLSNAVKENKETLETKELKTELKTKINIPAAALVDNDEELITEKIVKKRAGRPKKNK